MDRAALRAAAMGEKKEGGGGGASAAADGGAGAAASRALQQCGQLQKLIDISIGSLRGLRTKCSVSNDLTQQEIRTLEAKLVRYICKQRQSKLSVTPSDRTAELNSYPRFSDWLYIFNVRPEVVQEIPQELTLDALLEMDEAKAKEMLRRWGASAEECSRLQQALTCLRKVTGLGGEHKEDSGWSSAEARESSSGPSVDMLSSLGRAGASTQGPRSISVSALPASDSPVPGLSEGLSDTCIPLHTSGRLTPRALHSFITPPTTPQLRRHAKLKPPRTPPPPSRKVFQLLPSFPTLTRSKSHESQLGNRIDEVAPMRFELPHGSPQLVRRDIGLPVTHRFSTKSWLSQVCNVCQKSMMFGVKCKHCRLKCHNKCTKEAPACRISFLPLARLRRTESVPSDINNPVDRAAEPHFGTLPKALTKKEHPPAMNLDSSSNPSSTTSSTPSSPAPFLTSSNPSSATTPPNPSPGQRDSRFNFPGITPLGFSGSLGIPSDLSTSPLRAESTEHLLSGIDGLRTDEDAGVKEGEKQLALHCTQSQSHTQICLTQSLGSWGDPGCLPVLGVPSAQHHPLSELMSKLGSDTITRNLQQNIGPLLHTKFCETGSSSSKKTSHSFLCHPETTGN